MPPGRRADSRIIKLMRFPVEIGKIDVNGASTDPCPIQFFGGLSQQFDGWLELTELLRQPRGGLLETRSRLQFVAHLPGEFLHHPESTQRELGVVFSD